MNSHSLIVHKETFCLGYKEITNIEMQRSNSLTFDSNNKENQSLEFSKITENEIKNSNIRYSNEEEKLHPKKTQPILDLLNDYKKKKSYEQSLKDMEDTLIRDTIRDKKMAVTITNVPPVHASVSPSALDSITFSNGSSAQLHQIDPYKKLLNEVYIDFKSS